MPNMLSRLGMLNRRRRNSVRIGGGVVCWRVWGGSVKLSLPLDGYLYLDDIGGSMLEIAFSIVIGVGIAVMIYLYEYGERDD